MTERIGKGSMTGRWQPRPGACPNIRGGITIERDLRAGTKLWLTGWTKTITGGELVSLVVEIADNDGRPHQMIRSPSLAPAAKRMRVFRRRRRLRRLLVKLEIDRVEVDALVTRRYLKPEERDDLQAVTYAANCFFSDALMAPVTTGDTPKVTP